MASIQHFRFLDLPAEMRDEVYRLCLGRGKVYLGSRPAYDLRFEGWQKRSITWNALAINRQTREEAAKVLFLENTMVLGPDLYQQLFHNQWEHASRDFQAALETKRKIWLSTLARKHMISLSLTFTPRNAALDPVVAAASARQMQYIASTLTQQSHSLDERILHCHGMSPPDGWKALFNAAELCPLRFLQLDVSYCYDSPGRCRAVDTLSDCIAAFVAGMPASLKTMEILGTKSREERELLKQDLNDALSGRFDPNHPYLAAGLGVYISGTQKALQERNRVAEEIRDRTPLRLRFKKFQASSDWRVKGLDREDLEGELEDEEIEMAPPRG